MNSEDLQACLTWHVLIKYVSLLFLYFTKQVYLAVPWLWDLNRITVVSANWFSLHTKMDWIFGNIDILWITFFLFLLPSILFCYETDLYVGFRDTLFWAWQSQEPGLPDVGLWRCDAVIARRGKQMGLRFLAGSHFQALRWAVWLWALVRHHKGYKYRVGLVFWCPFFFQLPFVYMAHSSLTECSCLLLLLSHSLNFLLTFGLVPCWRIRKGDKSLTYKGVFCSLL